MFLEGALRGRSPCTREGRRPDRPNDNHEERVNTCTRLIQVRKSIVAE